MRRACSRDHGHNSKGDPLRVRRWRRFVTLTLVFGACSFAVWAGLELWVKESRGASTPRAAVQPVATALDPSTVRRLVAHDGTPRRDLSCRSTSVPGHPVLCTYLESTTGSLPGSEIAALLVRRGLNGTLTEEKAEPVSTTLADFITTADQACEVRTRAVAGLAGLPSQRQIARLLQVEQKFEQALVAGGPVARTGPISPQGFLEDFLEYEQQLVQLHHDVAAGAPLNVTRGDLTFTRSSQRGVDQFALENGVDCEFRTPLTAPVAPTHSHWQALPPARRAPAHVDESPRANPEFTARRAVGILAANPNDSDIHCGPGTNGWTYLCSYLNAGQLHRTGFLAKGQDGEPLAVDLPAHGPVPGPNS